MVTARSAGEPEGPTSTAVNLDKLPPPTIRASFSWRCACRSRSTGFFENRREADPFRRFLFLPHHRIFLFTLPAWMALFPGFVHLQLRPKWVVMRVLSRSFARTA